MAVLHERGLLAMARRALFALALALACAGGSLADEDDEEEARDPVMERLLDKVFEGDVEGVQAALDDGADPDAVGEPEGWSVLMRAVHKSTPEVIKLLVESGAQVNRLKKGGGSALLYAAEWGKLAAASALLEAGADPNAKSNVKEASVGPTGQRGTSGGNCPIHAATWSGNVEMVKLLLEHGADPKKANEDGKTPRSIAVDNGILRMIKVLDPNDEPRPEDKTGCEDYHDCASCTGAEVPEGHRGCSWCMAMPRTGKPACVLDKPRICSHKDNHIGKAVPGSECPAEDDPRFAYVRSAPPICPSNAVV